MNGVLNKVVSRLLSTTKLCWWLEWIHQLLPLISPGSVFILSGEILPFLICNDESGEVWRERGRQVEEKNRNNKWQLLYLVAEKLFVSLHGCFLRGSSWAILMSISACALALGWQTKYWGTSSVIAEAKLHSSCDNYLKKMDFGSSCRTAESPYNIVMIPPKQKWA